MFAAVACALPLALLLAAELVARLVWPAGGERDPFLTLGAPVSTFREIEVGGERFYEVVHPGAYGAGVLRFPVHKPPGTLRVFCFGASAAAGWPHPPGQGYSDHLARALQAAWPDRHVEVLNLSAHAYASYRVRAIFDDAISLAPDLVIVYSGNNEFVERRSYLNDSGLRRVVHAVERQSRLVQLLAGWLRLELAPAPTLSASERQDRSWHLWTHTERVALELRSDPEQLRRVFEHYEYSLEHIASTCEARGVPMLLLTVPSNLRDWRPHVSAHGLTGEPLSRWERHWRTARRALAQEPPEPAAALAALEAAQALAPDHAESRYLAGRACEALGRRDEARAQYRAAKDLDLNPFRALSLGNDAVRRVAARHEHVYLVDAERAFDEAATGAAPGFDLFLDYVHPSRTGNLLLARLVRATILRERLLGGATGVAPAELDAAMTAGDGYVDDADLGMQVTLLGLYSTMHQYEAFLPKLALVRRLLAERSAALPPDAAALMDSCERAFTDYLAQQRQDLLGLPFEAGYEERHREFYRRFFGAFATLKGGFK